MEFDPVDLRMKRQAALANAMSQPLLSKGSKEGSFSKDVGYAEQYPFVFDSQTKAKSAAGSMTVIRPLSLVSFNGCFVPGFIQGVKMSLPAGFERKDDKKFEEVSYCYW